MTAISFLYPRREGTRFDLPYYVEKHMPWSISLLSTHPGFRGVSVDGGLSGAPGTDSPPYWVICRFLLDSVDDFLTAVTPHLAALQADMQNYTDVEPTFQVSQVLISR